jgi:putative transposase
MNETDRKSWIHPVSKFTTSRRRLPHLQSPGSHYFTDSNTFQRQLLSEEERDIVFNAIFFLDSEKYELSAAVVMPDHFHLILKPLLKDESSYYSLEEIFHSLKSFTAKQIIKKRFPNLHKPKGAKTTIRIWQDENYDHLIRNEKDWFEKLEYLIYNPVVAELVNDPYDYRWLWHIGMARPTANPN